MNDPAHESVLNFLLKIPEKFLFPKTDKKLVSYDFVYENFRLDHFDSIFNLFFCEKSALFDKTKHSKRTNGHCRDFDSRKILLFITDSTDS